MSSFSKNLLEYYTSQSGSQIYINNMKSIHPSLTERSIYGLALLATNPALSQEERDMFKRCLEIEGKATTAALCLLNTQERKISE